MAFEKAEFGRVQESWSKGNFYSNERPLTMRGDPNLHQLLMGVGD